MNRYLRWYASLHKFYRILFWASISVGVFGVVAGLTTESVPMAGLGVFWLVGGPAVIYLASLFDSE
jgi:hypothetical protein